MSLQNANKVVIYPYRFSEQDSPLLTESELRESYPNAYSYLCEYREVLESRGSEDMEYPS